MIPPPFAATIHHPSFPFSSCLPAFGQTAPRRGTSGNANDGNVIYGPMEAGFTTDQTTQFFGCTGGVTLAAGIDTRQAELMIQAQAMLGNCNAGVTLLDSCGGHAQPYHYHEHMTCLHTNDAGTGHSTSVATMLDGKMLCEDLLQPPTPTLADPTSTSTSTSRIASDSNPRATVWQCSLVPLPSLPPPRAHARTHSLAHLTIRPATRACPPFHPARNDCRRQVGKFQRQPRGL